MPYDAFLAAAVARELDSLLNGRSVAGVEIAFGGDVVISFGPRREPAVVVLALDPVPCVYGHQGSLNGPGAAAGLWPGPPAGLVHFTRLLDARITGRPAAGVKALAWERTLEIAFAPRSGLRGGGGPAWVVHQAAPKPARVILLGRDRTVAALWPPAAEGGPVPGEAYNPPTPRRAASPSELARDYGLFEAALHEAALGEAAGRGERPSGPTQAGEHTGRRDSGSPAALGDPAGLLLRAAPALGPEAVREVVRKARHAGEGRVTPAALHQALKEVVSIYPCGPFRPAVITRRDRPQVPAGVTAAASAPGPGLVLRPATSAGLAVAGWHRQARLDTAVRDTAARVRRGLRKALRKARRKLERRAEEQTEVGEVELLRLKGELLLAHLHDIGRGQSQVTVAGYDGRPVVIDLEPRLGVAENAQRYFARYRKAKRAAGRSDLLRTAENELAWLESVAYDLERVLETGGGEGQAEDTLTELLEIERTLQAAGYLPPRAPGPGRPRSRAAGDRRGRSRTRPAAGRRPPLRYVTGDGLTVLAARSARQNEVLSLKMARPDDLWFHVRGRPGSHVLLRLPPERAGTPPERSVYQAAAVAAHLSAARDGGKVEVDYTRARNLRRPKGAPPGLVLYDPHDTLLVDTDRVPLPAEAPGPEDAPPAPEDGAAPAKARR